MQRKDFQQARRCVAIAVFLWIAALAVVALITVTGHLRADVWQVYAAAAQRWLTRQPLYDTHSIDAFQYFPQAAMVFGLFARLGKPLGDVLWRAAGWGLFAHATWRWSALTVPARAGKLFLIATAILIPPALTSALNGQANLHIAALMMQAAADLSRRRWWRVTAWSMIGLAIKPIMVVMVLLMCVQYPLLIGRTVLGAGLLVVVPAVAAPVSYVVDQYRDCLTKLALSAQPDRFFEDLRGLVWSVGWALPFSVLRVTRLVAALAVAGVCLRIRRSWKEPAPSLFLFAFAAVYLMLFNTRTQPNSYVIMAPAAALPAAAFFLQRRWRPAWAMLAIVGCWWGSAIPPTAHWLKPLACIAFCALLLRESLGRPAAGFAGGLGWLLENAQRDEGSRTRAPP